MPAAQALATYRAAAPVLPDSIGQGEAPASLVVEQDGERLEIAYGTIVKASATCDPVRGLANLDAEPLPLVRTSLIDALPGVFVLLTPAP